MRPVRRKCRRARWRRRPPKPAADRNSIRKKRPVAEQLVDSLFGSGQGDGRSPVARNGHAVAVRGIKASRRVEKRSGLVHAADRERAVLDADRHGHVVGAGIGNPNAADPGVCSAIDRGLQVGERDRRRGQRTGRIVGGHGVKDRAVPDWSRIPPDWVLTDDSGPVDWLAGDSGADGWIADDSRGDGVGLDLVRRHDRRSGRQRVARFERRGGRQRVAHSQRSTGRQRAADERWRSDRRRVGRQAGGGEQLPRLERFEARSMPTETTTPRSVFFSPRLHGYTLPWQLVTTAWPICDALGLARGEKRAIAAGPGECYRPDGLTSAPNPRIIRSQRTELPICPNRMPECVSRRIADGLGPEPTHVRMQRLFLHDSLPLRQRKR